jgi:hypothetical protein
VIAWIPTRRSQQNDEVCVGDFLRALGLCGFTTYRVGLCPNIELPWVASQDRCANAALGPVVSITSPRSMAAMSPLFTVNKWRTSLSERTPPSRLLTT